MLFITLYKNKSPNNVLDKKIEKMAEISGYCREETNVQSPRFLIEADLKNANYCYIPQFCRYYYIKSSSKYNDKLTRIDLDCDVLMSFKESIKTMRIIVERQIAYNKYVNDNYTVELKEEIERKDFDKLPAREEREIVMINTKGGKWD